jgi:hypothetical protein
MDKIFKALGISEENTKPLRIKKTFNKVKDNVPHIKNYNFMADVLFLPETKKGFKYLLVVVDIGTNACDFEPIKDKASETILQAFQKIMKRKYLDKPYASIRTDDGKEFRGVFQSWMTENSIFHKISAPGRHKQTGNVEILNKDLGRILNGYMNSMEEKTGKQYKEWIEILPTVRKMLNEFRIIPEGDPFTDVYPSPDVVEAKFKVGDIVYRIADEPLDALGNKQPTKAFRTGDYRWDLTPRRIVRVLRYSGKVPIRYLLHTLPNVSYAEWELKKATETEAKYQVQYVSAKRTLNGVKEILIKYKGIKEKTWQNYNNIKKQIPNIEDYMR